MPSNSLSKASNLARIRENQRRSRARRREYVVELEQKVRNYEQGRLQATIEVQTTAQKLARENEILRRLLRTVGYEDKFQDEYITSQSRELPATSRIEASISPMQLAITPSEWTQPPPLTDQTTDSLLADFVQFPDGLNEEPTSVNNEFSVDFNNSLTVSRSSNCYGQTSSCQDTTQIQPSAQEYSGGVPSFLSTSLESEPAYGLVEDGTTLCAVAYSLLTKNNKKGYTDLDLNVKLCRGFRNGNTPLEGCRVENKVLFTVLAEIS